MSSKWMRITISSTISTNDYTWWERTHLPCYLGLSFAQRSSGCGLDLEGGFPLNQTRRGWSLFRTKSHVWLKEPRKPIPSSIGVDPGIVAYLRIGIRRFIIRNWHLWPGLADAGELDFSLGASVFASKHEPKSIDLTKIFNNTLNNVPHLIGVMLISRSLSNLPPVRVVVLEWMLVGTL